MKAAVDIQTALFETQGICRGQIGARLQIRLSPVSRVLRFFQDNNQLSLIPFRG
jgi:hypothetical protein